MTKHTDIASAIAHSVAHNEIAHVEASDLAEYEALRTELIDAADDYANTVAGAHGDGVDVWGTVPGGAEWRVVIARPIVETQTLAQAIYLAKTGKSAGLARAAGYLHGCPVGRWGQTVQARRQLAEELPRREDREYTVDEFIAEAYTESNGHYYRRPVMSSLSTNS